MLKDFTDSFIQDAPLLFCAVNPDFRVITMNRTALQALGYRLQEVVGKDYITHFAPPEDREVMEGIFQTLMSTTAPTFSTNRVLARDGRILLVEWYGRQIFHRHTGELDYFFGLGIDITERTRVEEELRRINEELEARVAERTATLQQTNEALRESILNLQNAQDYLVQSQKMAALGQLVAGVAHEINTPVGIGVTAASYLELKTEEFAARWQGAGNASAELTQYLQLVTDATASILTNLKRAADLVRSFKQVAVDQTSEAQRTFLLKDYIEQVLLSLRPKYKRTRHTIAVNCPDNLEIKGYPGALSQIITNLVINSLVHGFKGIEAGQINLDVQADNGQLVFHYRDNGRGIPKQHLTRVFDPFFTTRRARDGSGLGLHVVYNLITQILHGQIECRSPAGQGTHFTIQLPVEVNRLGPVGSA